MVDPNTRQGKRAPVTLKIKFKSATLEQFIERYAVDVSHGGIFIRTKEPLAVGTQMRFEFQLRDATPLITGEGTVVWTRENDPARPGVAPGMGVRFDRLNEGSQQILDRILAEKAKGVGTHAPSDTKPPIFNEAPTKVAPSPLVGALKDESKPKIGQMAPPRAGFGDERTDATPLPKPMPFHSDADEFPEEAFEEATKVRSLEDLVAQTKDIDGMSPAKIAAAVAAKSSGPLMDDKATTKMPSAGGLAAPVAAVLTPPPAPVAPSHAAETAAAHAAAAHAAALKDELAERRAAKMADPEPIAAAPVPEAPKLPIGGTTTEPSLPSLPPFREPAFVQKASSFAATPAPAPSSKAKPAPAPSPKGKAAAAAPEPVREAPPRGAPVGLLLLLLVVLGGAAAFWFFYLRNRGDHGSTGGEGSGSISDDDNGSGSASGPASGSASGGSAIASGAGSAVAGSASGTGAASGGSGSASGSGSAVATADLADVAITSSTAGATVDIADAGVTGAALPYKGQLEKGKTFTAHVSAPGHIAQDVDVTGGGKAIDVKLKAMPHVVHITSTPGGAMIFVDGQPTRRTTPGDVDITAAQAATGARIELRKAGYDRFVKSIRSDAFSEDTDHLLANLDATLVVARVVPQNGGGNVIRHPGGGSGSSTGSGSSAGSGSASGAGSGSVGPVTMPGGSGSGSGSATAGSAATGSGSAGSATTTTGSGASTGSGAGSASSSSGSGSGAGSSKGSGAGSSSAGSSKGSGAGSSSAGSGSSSAGSGSGSGSEPTPDWMK